jgi:hypothetical protein
MSVNERKLNGAPLVSDLHLLYAAVRSFPDYKQLDYKWFPPLIGGVPLEPESVMRERKLKKWLPYDPAAMPPIRSQTAMHKNDWLGSAPQRTTIARPWFSVCTARLWSRDTGLTSGMSAKAVALLGLESQPAICSISTVLLRVWRRAAAELLEWL